MISETQTKIAEFVGFTDLHISNEWEETGGPDGYEGFYEVLRGTLNGQRDTRVPNYHRSLDALQGAEEKLSEEQWREYRRIMLNLSTIPGHLPLYLEFKKLISFPAEVRAKALLLAVETTPCQSASDKIEPPAVSGES